MTGKKWKQKDTIVVNGLTSVAFWSRFVWAFKLLLGARLETHVEIDTENLPGEVGSRMTVVPGRIPWLPRRKKNLVYGEVEAK